MKIENIKISVKLGLGFGLLLVLMLLMSGIGILRLQTVGAAADSMIRNDLFKERLATELITAIETNTARTLAAIRTTNKEHYLSFREEILAFGPRNVELWAQLDKLITTEQGRRLFTALGDQRTTYIEIRTRLFKLKDDGDDAAAQAGLDAEFMPVMVEYLKRAHALVKHQQNKIDDAAANINQTFVFGRTLLLGLSAAALLIGLFAAWRLALGITRPLGLAVEAARRVAAGDLSHRIASAGTDEIGQLLLALHDMNARLLDTVRQVRGSSDTIAASSAEIASGNLDLSSRTEQQASSLEETASAMEQLTATVRQNADNARQATSLAAAASDLAHNGGVVVGDVVRTMDDISTASHKIADIISVIDGIAFQTNILALNAAVEAARAGDQGRGFAVVATEVRNLAHRSAAAAKEISQLIGDSVGKVENGTLLVRKAGATMNDVVASVRKVADIVQGISVASHEQSTGIEEVNRAIAQMDQVTQQNAALVEEAAAAAASLEDQAGKMASLVQVFKLDGQVEKAAVRAAQPKQAVRRLAYAG